MCQIKLVFWVDEKNEDSCSLRAAVEPHGLVSQYHGFSIAASEIGPIEFQNQQTLPIRNLAFLPVDGRPHPVSGSMVLPDW